MPRVLQIDPRDNVWIALEDLHRGDTVTIGSEPVVLPADVPCKHKLVTEEREPGDEVVMYGELVVRAGDRCRDRRSGDSGGLRALGAG